MSNIDFNNIYKYHNLSTIDAERCESIRTKAKELAILIDGLVPDSREKSLALTKIEEAMMWANAGIARNNHL